MSNIRIKVIPDPFGRYIKGLQQGQKDALELLKALKGLFGNTSGGGGRSGRGGGRGGGGGGRSRGGGGGRSRGGGSGLDYNSFLGGNRDVARNPTPIPEALRQRYDRVDDPYLAPRFNDLRSTLTREAARRDAQSLVAGGPLDYLRSATQAGPDVFQQQATPQFDTRAGRVVFPGEVVGMPNAPRPPDVTTGDLGLSFLNNAAQPAQANQAPTSGPITPEMGLLRWLLGDYDTQGQQDQQDQQGQHLMPGYQQDPDLGFRPLSDAGDAVPDPLLEPMADTTDPQIIEPTGIDPILLDNTSLGGIETGLGDLGDQKAVDDAVDTVATDSAFDDEELNRLLEEEIA
ncbi:MAG: hypothetical protein WAS51_14535 [Ilumatobacteraceae bacterium]